MDKSQRAPYYAGVGGRGDSTVDIYIYPGDCYTQYVNKYTFTLYKFAFQKEQVINLQLNRWNYYTYIPRNSGGGSLKLEWRLVYIRPNSKNIENKKKMYL